MSTIPLGAYGTLSNITGANGTQAASLSSLTATIDKPTMAYLVPQGTASVSIFPIQSALPADGGTTTVTVTFNGKSQNGTDVPALSLQVAIQDFAAPVQATSLVFNGPFSVATVPSNPPPNPGTATVTLI